jgi:hypothetical protein
MEKIMDLMKPFEQLRKKRPIFSSEKDFQFALAWEIKLLYNDANVHLEYCPDITQNVHIDIFVEINNKIYPIELKYKTKRAFTKIDNEIFCLKNQAAQTLGKYDFLKDFQRMENLAKIIQNFDCGYTLLLTNDPSYWEKNKKDAIDVEFQLLHGIIKTGKMEWKGASNGTIKGREAPINLMRKYKIEWKQYSQINIHNGIFKYSFNEIYKL